MELVSGWGRTAPTAARVVPAGSEAVVAAALASAPERGVIARGLGRSYGDPAQNAGGAVLDMAAGRGGFLLDAKAGTVLAGAGTSLDELLRGTVPRGWFVPVTPGTRYVTVGGALASDIHGKNHHGEGSFGDHVEELSVMLASGETRVIGPERDAELFWATVGGMGLTGIVTSCRFRMLPVETSQMLVDTERCHDLDDVMARMAEGDHRYRYSVAWVDLLATGATLGRSVLTRGDHAPLVALGARRRERALDFHPKVRLQAPAFVPGGLLNRASVRAFNELWFHKAPRRRRDEVVSIASFFHPLDAVGDWNRLYGPGGFVQYQFVVPFGAERALRRAVERVSGSRAGSFLAVLKRFGPANPGPLSFPMPGWTLTVDLPARHDGLPELLDDLDDLVEQAGGRLYLAKDARMDPRRLAVMYPRLPEWQATRDAVDPEGVLQSDLGRRLGLCRPRHEKTP